MEEARSLGCGGDSSSSRVASSFEKIGDRTRFTVELRPGETTIVSWKKLMKDASKASGSAPPPETSPSGVHPALESCLAPGQPDPNEVNELKEAAQPSRFNSVIEKIERLYVGKNSSDDEDLGDIPDDDQYDTEDSFIDDAELDEYFEVDKLKTKHDGFFVNRGKLENLEPSLPPPQQPKKRRRKDMVKGTGESDEGHPHKHLKVGRKGSAKAVLSAQNGSLLTSLSPSRTYAQTLVGETKPTLDGITSLKNGDTAKALCDKLKETSEFSDSGHMKYYERSGPTHVQELETSFHQREKSGQRECIDLNLPAGKHPIQNVKSSLCHRREGSNLKPKGNILERAIRELEKLVAESRPHAADPQDADATYQATKRRLPREIKQKLAKVARAVQVSHGKVSKEILNRLMGILGHLINLRTLKRNLKILISESLSVNQEKDDKFQHIKKEVVELIKEHGSSLVSKAIEQQTGSADEFQESHRGDKGAVKVRYSMDPLLEDKICDLYDIFVDGLDDDVARHARKLYAELAELWPKGTMDNHGIKRAICHAKERRRIFHDGIKDHERIKPKNSVEAKIEQRSQVDSCSAAQPEYKEGSIFGANVATYQKSSVPTNNMTTSPDTTLSLSNSSMTTQDSNLSKQEKVKGIATSSHVEFRKPDGTLVKKKVKRKPEVNLNEVHSRPEKEKASQYTSEDRQNNHKQQYAEKSSFQLLAP